jgi:hypothetical protein
MLGLGPIGSLGCSSGTPRPTSYSIEAATRLKVRMSTTKNPLLSSPDALRLVT